MFARYAALVCCVICEHREQTRLDVADDALAQVDEVDPRLLVEVGMLRLEAACEHGGGRLGAIDRQSGGQARDRTQHDGSTRRRDRVQTQWPPQVSARRHDRTKPGGKHADDLVRLTAEGHGPADDVGRGSEVPPPDAVADHHHARGIGDVVFATTRPAERGNDAEHREVLMRDLLAGNGLRLGAADQCRPPRGHDGDFLEERLFAAPVGVVSRCRPLVSWTAACPHVLPDRDEPIGGVMSSQRRRDTR